MVYQLLIATGNTLLQGLLEAEDVWVCFEMLDAQTSAGKILGFDATKLKELREIHAAWMQRKEEEEQGNVGDTEGLQAEGQGATAAEVSAEVETPVAFVPQDLPAAMASIDIPSSILQDIVSPSALHAVESPPETFISFPAGTASCQATLTQSLTGTNEVCKASHKDTRLVCLLVSILQRVSVSSSSNVELAEYKLSSDSV
ncbi:hypothetical protein BDM02DRAFT_3193259 [Thelephora ganbajun]|uniref:Uncharacterized protein n=1 Tax=Thelephora ganbajun TaxID=370292 RepID=A0ACB6YZ18_THEGA|nr:hypothetical protein BDM02DRAFT_3193259 [Thelephora ganbajun]